jgi:phosphoglycolate phosphatase
VKHLLCFDLDGTLEDSRADMVASVHRVRARLKTPSRSDDAVRPHVNKGMEQLYRACFDDVLAGSDARLEEVRLAYEADYLAHVADETKLYPGIADALAELATLGTLAVVTNKPEKISRRLLDALGVGARFATVIGGDTCGEIKPSVKVMQAAAAAVGFDASKGKSAIAGDTDADIKMGRAFGASTVWCAWGYLTAPDVAPHETARAPADLPAAFRRVLG